MTSLVAAVAGLLDLARRDVQRRPACWRALDALVRPADEALVSRELRVHDDDEDGDGAWSWRQIEWETFIANRHLRTLLDRSKRGATTERGSTPPSAPTGVVPRFDPLSGRGRTHV